ncbi:hypothetical protein R50073_17880 [Maricurvus nonylphenolicus]
MSRIDERNSRVFVITSPATFELQNQLKTADACLRNLHWPTDRSITVFSEAKYVGYKDEEHISPLHKDNQWSKAYLAEYFGASDKFIRMPALSP